MRDCYPKVARPHELRVSQTNLPCAPGSRVHILAVLRLIFFEPL